MEQYPLWHKRLWTHSIFTLHWEWNIASCFTPNLTNSLAYTDKIFKLCNLDEISSRIVKISAPYVLSLLTYIFNKVLSTGIFPERLQFSEVRPLFKKGDITEFSNYRPISLLTSFSKIIEKIIFKRLCNYLNDNNILVGD